MKKETEKEGKVFLMIFISVFIILLLISTISAGWWENFKKTITGKDTQTEVIGMNITIGIPTITRVYNASVSAFSNGPNEAPASTSVLINFTVYYAVGVANLNHSSAMVNFTLAGEDTRQNLTCIKYENITNYANYTCNVTMWWWDGTGSWSISTYIEDNNQNAAINTSRTITMGERTGFELGPKNLTWPGFGAGAENKTSNNDPILLNNTGNDNIAAESIKVNATHLRGETTTTEALWATNFSVSWKTGGSCSGTDCVECAGAIMVYNAFTPILIANLTNGNFTRNLKNSSSGQEELYFCLRLAGSELSSQVYSTKNESEGSWTIQIS